MQLSSASSSHKATRKHYSGHTVLVVDDSEAVRTALDVLLSLYGLKTIGAESPAAALATLERETVSLVIQDMNFKRDITSGEEGITLFRHLRQRQPGLPIILLTAWTHLETAVQLVKEGAADYLAKPWDDARLVTTVANVLELQAARDEVRFLRQERLSARARLAEKYDLRGIVYESSAMHGVVATAVQVAHADVPVLITGANGTGKEVIADILQANSSCRSGPYIKVNVGALPSELMESELFGAESGAYTGARAREGRFEAADGGTLFLDEIGNLSLAGQAKLLRVLQTGEFERLGSTVTRRVNVRLICATNANLRAAIEQERFREDLYYRINVIELPMPSLAERREDVLALARHFLEPRFRLSDAAERSLLAHHWPGNVRELKNCIRRACLMSSDSEIDVAALGLPPVDVRRSPEMEPDRATIEWVLAQTGQVVAHAARELGMSRQALYRRMTKLGIKSTSDESDA